MEKRTVDTEITMVPYYPDYETALAWYQDPELCRQVDNTDHVYSLDGLKRMYGYLCAHGECYYIQYHNRLIGDVTLKEDGEVCIVICREYQNRHIGRRCIKNLIALAREKGLTQMKAQIYEFNTQSRKMFKALGFEHTEGDWFVLDFFALPEAGNA